MRIAASAYPLNFFNDWRCYEAKLRDWVGEAARAGADLLVFPEYGAMELATLGGRKVAADLECSLRQVALHMPEAEALHAELAAEHGVYILAGSGPAFPITGGRPVNRAGFFGPEGLIGHAEKAMMTRFERESWNVVAGQGVALFDTRIGRIGVLICYDSEFPLLGRALAEAGAEVILVPSCTDSFAGFTRVRVGAMARALENQCVTVQSPTVGRCDWSPAVDENVGRAAIYAPPDSGWPESGIIAEGGLDTPGWVHAEIPEGAVARRRHEGAVRPFAHWPEQAAQAARLRHMTEKRNETPT